MEKDIRYFEKVKDELELKCPGKFVVIKNEEVIGVYDDAKTAFDETIQIEEKGTFIIREVKKTTTLSVGNSLPSGGLFAFVVVLFLASIVLSFIELKIATIITGISILLFAFWVYKAIKTLNDLIQELKQKNESK